ncbi:hypothetical protein ACVI1L_008447 [Bradyrhizobium sp. USDA 4516]
MWQLILEEVARELERRAAQWAGRKVFRKTVDGGEPNKPEAYADRINREFGLRDYFKAWNLYDSDRAYWEELFGNDPLNSPDHPASPPGNLLPRADAPPRYDYLNPATRGLAPSAGLAPADSFRRDQLNRRNRSTRRDRSWGHLTALRKNRTATERLSGGWCEYRRRARARPDSKVEHRPCRSFHALRNRGVPPHSASASGDSHPQSLSLGLPSMDGLCRVLRCRRRSFAFRTIPTFRRWISIIGLPV